MAVWRLEVDEESVRNAVRRAYPEMLLEEKYVTEEDLRRLIKIQALLGDNREGGGDTSSKEDIYNQIRQVFLDIFIREAFQEEKDCGLTGTAQKQDFHQLIRPVLSYETDADFSECRKAFNKLVQRLISSANTISVPREVGRSDFTPNRERIQRFIRYGFPELEDEAMLSHEEKLCKLALVLLQPEETFRCPAIPRSVQELVAAMNRRTMESDLEYFMKKNKITSAGDELLSRSVRGIIKTMRILEKGGFREAVGSFERYLSYTFWWILVVFNVVQLVSAVLLNERTFIQRTYTAVIYIYAGMFNVWRIGFLSLWFLWNWSRERILGSIAAGIIFLLAGLIKMMREAYDEAWFIGMAASISSVWQIFVQYLFTVRDLAYRAIAYRQLRMARKRGDWKAFDQDISFQLTTVEQFALSIERAKYSGSDLAFNRVPIRVRMERQVKFFNTWEVGRNLEFMLHLQKNYCEGVLNVLIDCNRFSSARLRCLMGHVEPYFEKAVYVFVTVIVFGILGWLLGVRQRLNFSMLLTSAVIAVLLLTIVVFKVYQSPERARLVFIYQVSSFFYAIFTVAIPYKENEDILQSAGVFVALMLTEGFVGLTMLEPLALAIKYCSRPK